MRNLIAIILLLTASNAVAYLDPGTGSMLLQVILGGVAAILVAAKLYWHKIMTVLGMAKAGDSEDEGMANDGDSEDGPS
jgi:hypothetical protein